MIGSGLDDFQVVSSIVPFAGVAPVFNFEVEGTHVYFVEGVLTHNPPAKGNVMKSQRSTFKPMNLTPRTLLEP